MQLLFTFLSIWVIGTSSAASGQANGANTGTDMAAAAAAFQANGGTIPDAQAEETSGTSGSAGTASAGMGATGNANLNLAALMGSVGSMQVVPAGNLGALATLLNAQTEETGSAASGQANGDNAGSDMAAAFIANGGTFPGGVTLPSGTGTQTASDGQTEETPAVPASALELLQNGPPTNPAATAVCNNAAPPANQQLFESCLAQNPQHEMPAVFCDGFARYGAANTIWGMISAGERPSATQCAPSMESDVRMLSAVHGFFAPAGPRTDVIAVSFNYPILESATYMRPNTICPSGYLPPELFTVDGKSVTLATAQPATDDGEWTTLVLMGDFGADLSGKLVEVQGLDFVVPGGCTKAMSLSVPIHYNIKVLSAKVTMDDGSCGLGLDVQLEGGVTHPDGTNVQPGDFELLNANGAVLTNPVDVSENEDGDNFYKFCLERVRNPMALADAQIGLKCEGDNELYPPNSVSLCSPGLVDLVLPMSG